MSFKRKLKTQYATYTFPHVPRSNANGEITITDEAMEALQAYGIYTESDFDNNWGSFFDKVETAKNFPPSIAKRAAEE